jgi:hypothetical protein
VTPTLVSFPLPDRQVEGDDAAVARVLLELVDRALGKHAHKATITVDEYARDVAHCGRSTAYDAVRCGDIPSWKIAGRIVVPVPALAALLLGTYMNGDDKESRQPSG